MAFEELDKRMRRIEKEQCIRFSEYDYIVARLDGRNFTRLTKDDWPDLEVPYDNRFKDAMISTVKHLMRCGYEVVYGFTHSDEISLLFSQGISTFERNTQKFISILSSEASAHFSAKTGHIGVFDCRLIHLATERDVAEYFLWRQECAYRKALNSHLFWMYRKNGQTIDAIQKKINGLPFKHQLIMLKEGGIDFDSLPHWQLGGVGVFPIKIAYHNFDKTTGRDEISYKYRLNVEEEFPIGESFGKFFKASTSMPFEQRDFYMFQNDKRLVYRPEDNQYTQTLNILEQDCECLSESILNKMGWRVIKRIKKALSNIDFSDDLAELGFNIFDQMSIFYQTRSYGEFMPGFDDLLDNMIQAEIDALNAIERMILEYRDITLLSRGEMENKIFSDVKATVSSIIDNHYYCSRIQRLVDRIDIY